MIVYISILAFGFLLSVGTIYSQLSRFGLAALSINPICMFSFYFSLVHFVTPAIKAATGRFRYQPEYDYGLMVYAAVLSIIYFAFAAWINSIFFNKTKRMLQDTKVHKDTRFSNRAIICGLALGVIGSYFAIDDLRNITSAAGSIDEFLVDRITFADDRSSARVFSNLLIPASALLLAANLQSRPKLLATTAWIAFSSIIIFHAFAVSSRNTIVVFGLINLCVLALFKSNEGRAKIVHFLKRTGMVIFSATVVGLLVYQTTVARYSSADTAFLDERRNAVFFYMLDGAFGNDEARIWLLENEQSLLLGSTFAAAFLNVVPRDVWPDKPLGAGPILINYIRPGAYVLGQTGNSSLTTGLITEGQMNFGVLGVFPLLFLWAFLANRFSQVSLTSNDVTKKTVFLMLMVFSSSTLLYAEFLGFFARTATIVAPCFFLAWALRITLSTKSERWSQ